MKQFKLLAAAMFVPLLSMAILTVGNGFLGSLVTLRLGVEHLSSSWSGLIGAGYFAGMLIGSLFISKTINLYGPIQTFGFFTALLALSALGLSLYFSAEYWLILRVLAGIASAGIFIIIESWLLGAGAEQYRGRIMAVYMMVYYLAQASGQLLLNKVDSTGFEAYVWVAVLCCLGMLPLNMVKPSQSSEAEHEHLPVMMIAKVAFTGVLAVLCAGLILGAIYGMLPLYFQQKGLAEGDIGVLMAIIIGGGVIFQYPIGQLADRVNRKKMLVGQALLMALMALSMPIFSDKMALYLGAFLLGGIAFTFYPVAMGHTCARLTKPQLVAATRAMMIIYGLGAAAGPFIAGLIMHWVGYSALFSYIAAVALLYVVFIAVKLPKLRRARMLATG